MIPTGWSRRITMRRAVDLSKRERASVISASEYELLTDDSHDELSQKFSNNAEGYGRGR